MNKFKTIRPATQQQNYSKQTKFGLAPRVFKAVSSA